MTVPPPIPPESVPPSAVRALAEQLAKGDRSIAMALHALISVADPTGLANVDAVIRVYRDDYLAALRATGRDAEREAGRLSLDEVRQHLSLSVFPRLAGDGIIVPPFGGFQRAPQVWFSERTWRDIVGAREALATILRETGEHAGVPDARVATPVRPAAAVRGSVLEAHAG